MILRSKNVIDKHLYPGHDFIGQENFLPSYATASSGICEGSNAPLRRLIPYSTYAFRQARKLAHPPVLPASHLIPASSLSLLFSLTVTKVPSFVCCNDISTLVVVLSAALSQYHEIYLSFSILSM